MKITDEFIKKVLVEQNYITEIDLKKAEEYGKKRNSGFLYYLFSENLLTEDIYGQAIAEYLRVPFVNLNNVKIDQEIFTVIPELVAKTNKVIAFGRSEQGVKVAMRDPTDIEIIQLIEKRMADNVVPHFAIENQIEEVFSRYKGSLRDEFIKILDSLKREDLTREERDNMIIKIVDLLLKYAYQNKASDIHLEPYEKKVLIRYRIDGILQDVLDIPKDLYEYILTRIKILSKMRTDEHRAAQDGKMKYDAGDEKLDIRVSVVPVTQGETVVMRLLSARSRQFGLTDLGMHERDLKKVKQAIKHPHGMILVTGPTGSGKTTTLYAILKILNSRQVNIATIEDPVEYDIEGISQIQVNTKTNLTFAKGLRSIVRQDPDIIMVGEIRDEETAGIAINSALTGHLVLSTLHTNDAATTLPRLLDMDVEPFLVASTINVVVAQRLVREICQKCRTSTEVSKDHRHLIDNSPFIGKTLAKLGYKDLKGLRFYKGTGCPICANTGYSGRIGIFEVLEMDEEIKQAVLDNASSDEIAAIARKNGMTTMMEDGLDKVVKGITTLEEVLRVTSE